MTRKPKTIKQVLRTALVKAFFVSVAATIGFLLMATQANTGATIIDGAGDGNYGRPNAVGSPAYLVEKNDCWTGEAPANMQGQVPGHVVARLDGEVLSKVYGSKVVGQALEQIFEGKDHGITVHGFCR